MITIALPEILRALNGEDSSEILKTRAKLAAYLHRAIKNDSAPSSSGLFATVDSEGKYTYYPKLQAAINAAEPFQPIQVFGDYFETEDITITLKHGTVIFGNGFKYTLQGNSTKSAFSSYQVLSQDYRVIISDYKIERVSSTPGVFIQNSCIEILPNSQNFKAELFLDGCFLKGSNKACEVRTNEQKGYVYGGVFESTFDNNSQISSFAVTADYIVNVNAFSISTWAIYSQTRCDKSIGSSKRNNGIVGVNINDSKAYSDLFIAMLCIGGVNTNNFGFSPVQVGIAAGGYNQNVILSNSTGYSLSQIGISSDPMSQVSNCLSVSNTYYGMTHYANKATNNKIISFGNAASFMYFPGGDLHFNHIYSLWNNPGGHSLVIQVNFVNPGVISDNVLEVTNPNAFNITASDNFGNTSVYWAKNTYKKANTTTNGLTNRQTQQPDNFGNIKIG